MLRGLGGLRWGYPNPLCRFSRSICGGFEFGEGRQLRGGANPALEDSLQESTSAYGWEGIIDAGGGGLMRQLDYIGRAVVKLDAIAGCLVLRGPVLVRAQTSFVLQEWSPIMTTVAESHSPRC